MSAPQRVVKVKLFEAATAAEVEVDYEAWREGLKDGNAREAKSRDLLLTATDDTVVLLVSYTE